MTKTAKDLKLQNDIYWIEHGIDILRRKIMLDTDVNEDKINMIIRALQVMEENNQEPIELIINSFGGNINDGLALCDELESMQSLIRTHATGKIMSMAFIVYLLGDERYAKPRARFMHHGGYDNLEGKKFELKIGLKEFETLEELCDDIVSKQTGKDKKWWQKQIEFKDQFFGVEKAKKMGVVTHEYQIEEE